MPGDNSRKTPGEWNMAGDTGFEPAAVVAWRDHTGGGSETTSPDTTPRSELLPSPSSRDETPSYYPALRPPTKETGFLLPQYYPTEGVVPVSEPELVDGPRHFEMGDSFPREFSGPDDFSGAGRGEEPTSSWIGRFMGGDSCGGAPMLDGKRGGKRKGTRHAGLFC